MFLSTATTVSPSRVKSTIFRGSRQRLSRLKRKTQQKETKEGNQTNNWTQKKEYPYKREQNHEEKKETKNGTQNKQNKTEWKQNKKENEKMETKKRKPTRESNTLHYVPSSGLNPLPKGTISYYTCVLHELVLLYVCNLNPNDRSMCGVHYRGDSTEGMLLGEVVAVRMLHQVRVTNGGGMLVASQHRYTVRRTASVGCSMGKLERFDTKIVRRKTRCE